MEVGRDAEKWMDLKFLLMRAIALSTFAGM